MNDFCYCYWLQGFFELIKPTFLTKNQVYLIKEHLKLVERKEGIFCNWLEGFLELSQLETCEPEQTIKIKEKLRQEFGKIIDRTYPDQDILHKLHEGQSII